MLIFFASAGYFFWSTFSTVRGPGWEDGARRVERDSDLPNRPITEGTDIVAAGKGDPFAEKLWRAHIIRLLASAQRLTLKLPEPNMASRDPRGLRFAVLLGVVIGFVVAGPALGRTADVRPAAGVRRRHRQFGVRRLGGAAVLHAIAAAFAHRLAR